jgi:hypothetical protein
MVKPYIWKLLVCARKERASHLPGPCLRRLALHRSRMLPENDAGKQQLSWLLRAPCVSSRVDQDHEEDGAQADEGQRHALTNEGSSLLRAVQSHLQVMLVCECS